jgi:hypothetical protein
VRNGVLVSVIGIAVLAGCEASPGEAEPKESVEVPVTQAVPDDTYVLQGTATVTTEEYDDGFYGYVTIPARRGNSDSHRTPFLQGTLTLEGGQPVPCSMRRDYIWSDFDSFMQLNLKCDTDIDPTVATGFTIEPNG